MLQSPSLYGQSLALLTDLYEITMACGYWKSGMAEQEAVFHLFYRRQPFGGGFGIGCGLASVVEYLRAFRFDESDVAYLKTLRDNSGRPLFEAGFLDLLAKLDFACDIDAIPEGTVVFPEEPLVRVKGPLLQCQLLETALLNLINFQTLIATKAARVCLAAQGDAVFEFGLRRAQGVDGGVSASRAAYVGGCAGTSNVLAGKLYGIPVKGTHAHSWIMAFDTEQQAFDAYAEAMPDNSVFLVDTYDTIRGVKRAIQAGRRLAERGHRMAGIRLDSGDIAQLSIEARRLLDEAGFPDAAIVASNELDEYVIADLKQRGARVNMWGVGTKLATAFEEPALGGVYKLSAIRKEGADWRYRVKLSDEAAKVSNPGVLQVRRFRAAGEFEGDAIYDEIQPPRQGWVIAGFDDPSRRPMSSALSSEDLLQPVFRAGRCVRDTPGLMEIQKRTRAQLDALPAACKRLKDPATYLVGLEEGLSRLKRKLLAETE
jgi:nicotinate phosphoribosyltransferase